ncbi:MAG TPA: FAD:protein FMN transferase [Vicinamibacteria bacterium]|nr:FAD:protein FMN transferase [Vicinamibacteria bacterium]
MRRTLASGFGALACIAFLAPGSGVTPGLARPAVTKEEPSGSSVLREVRIVMGTTAEVRASGARATPQVLGAAFACLDRVDDAMSLWKESELTRLNARGRGRVSAGMTAVLDRALDVAASSDGAFDPTVEPLVRAAGGLGGQPRLLALDERRSLLSRVGFRRVHLDRRSGDVRLEPGTRLDLGGIAKGYAADLALVALQTSGAESGLVDLGGSSIGAFGLTLTVDVRDPEVPAAPPWASFRVSRGAVSSSGGDQRPRHIFDPRTGEPAARVLAATVVADTGIEADALSTAAYVLGENDGMRLFEHRGAAGLVLFREGARRVLRTTRGFRARYDLAAIPGLDVRE